MTNAIRQFMNACACAGLLAISTALFAGEAGSAVNPPDQQSAEEAWHSIQAYTVDKKNDALSYGNRLIRETDAGIADLKQKASRATGEAKAGYQKQIAELEKQRARTAAKLHALSRESGVAWDTAKRGFADAYRDLRQAYDRVREQIK